MTHLEPVHGVHEISAPRRSFLRNSIMLALPLMAAGLPAAASIAAPPAMQKTAYNPPSRSRGSAQTNVRNHGAAGNGSHDDTTAFQSAIDALPSGGGTVVVPAGTYLIDPTRNVRLRSKMHLRLDSGAVLKAKANSAERAYVLMVHKVNDVEISGGEIEGDRDRHTGNSGEWGHGIMVRGASRVTIRDILIRRCWGDGISIAASTDTVQVVGSDIVISNIACLGNRRQGMSIGQAKNVKVYDSEFSWTNGVSPGCGIDIESDNGNPNATNTHIENCLFQENQGNGIQVYKRSVSTTILNCVILKNHGYGVLAMGAKDVLVRYCDVTSNGGNGVALRGECTVSNVSQNTFYNNGRNYRNQDLPKLPNAVSRDGNFLLRHTEISNSQVNIWTNFYFDV